jgi:phospholipase/carboxylesterase
MSLTPAALLLGGSGPHAGQPVLQAGEPLGTASAALIMLHGRGASAGDMLALADNLAMPGFAFLAPQAAGNVWYPNRYNTPLAGNEPWLSSALSGIASLVELAGQHSIPPRRLILTGFSQGACLSTEYAARNARRYGGLAALAGGLIGPKETPRDYPGSLEGTPAFFGCSDPDTYFTPEWIRYSAAALERLDARIDIRLYPDLGHRVNLDMIHALRTMMEEI